MKKFQTIKAFTTFIIHCALGCFHQHYHISDRAATDISRFARELTTQEDKMQLIY
ncbi:MAG: hypothetical protein WC992_00620 [Acholeplasmataceae bacterium]|jgi:hypothetical protein|nr:hypothetical protein [Acholeplasmataceae bacterium]